MPSFDERIGTSTQRSRITVIFTPVSDIVQPPRSMNVAGENVLVLGSWQLAGTRNPC